MCSPFIFPFLLHERWKTRIERRHSNRLAVGDGTANMGRPEQIASVSRISFGLEGPRLFPFLPGQHMRPPPDPRAIVR